MKTKCTAVLMTGLCVVLCYLYLCTSTLMQLLIYQASLSSTESVHIVDLKGELKSNRTLAHEATFSHDVESIGEKIH